MSLSLSLRSQPVGHLEHGQFGRHGYARNETNTLMCVLPRISTQTAITTLVLALTVGVVGIGVFLDPMTHFFPAVVWVKFGHTDMNS